MSLPNTPAVSEPFPIFKVARKYMVYDVNVVTHIRAKYNIPGVLIGQLPQAPQQNIFSGIPLELMPEEARLLCEKGVGYVVDDAKSHKQGFLDRGLSEEERAAFRESLKRQGQHVANQVKGQAEQRTRVALGRKLAESSVENWNDLPEDMLRPSSRASKKKGKKARSGTVTPSELDSGIATPAELADKSSSNLRNGNVSDGNGGAGEDSNGALFPSSMSREHLFEQRLRRTSTASTGEPNPYIITPTTSYPPFAPPRAPRSSSSNTLDMSELDEGLPNGDSAVISELPDVPNSYALYKHLHSKDYFLTPGMRFGCQYTAYPGDPLRFHSHFLANGMGWDDEFDLLSLVGGGRLGTGVKKGFLVGGVEKKDEDSDPADGDAAPVRTFCVEWGGM